MSKEMEEKKSGKRKWEAKDSASPSKKRIVEIETSEEESEDEEQEMKKTSSHPPDEDVEMEEKKTGSRPSAAKPAERDVITDGKTRFYVYILESEQKGGPGKDFAYVGFTFENEHLDRTKKHGVARRLAQHNAVLSGGPPKTAKHRPLRVIATLTGDPSWFHERHARYVEKALQKLAPREFVRQNKWRKNPKSVGARYRKRYKDFPPPPPLPLIQVRGHAKVSREINLLAFFLHNFRVWPIRSERSSPGGHRRRRRGSSSVPLEPRSGEDSEHDVEIALHADFWEADLVRSIQNTCRYWSPRFVPLIVEPYVRRRSA